MFLKYKNEKCKKCSLFCTVLWLAVLYYLQFSLGSAKINFKIYYIKNLIGVISNEIRSKTGRLSCKLTVKHLSN